MKINALIELLDAAASTKFVIGPFDERGGIMIVGPPGSFKTSIIEAATECHSDAIVLSDLNVHQWSKMKDDFVTKRYTTLGFPEFEKLFQRHIATASNLEGIIKALVSEGFSATPGGDPRMPRLKARSLVIGGITTDCFERRYDGWRRNGFLRRFIWITTALKNPDLIVESIRLWRKIDFGKIAMRPANGQITVHGDDDLSSFIEAMMKDQPGIQGTAYVLLKKILAVLRWKYPNEPQKIMEILEDIAPALSRNGSELIIPNQPQP